MKKLSMKNKITINKKYVIARAKPEAIQKN
jgi:hypothetical protein